MNIFSSVLDIIGGAFKALGTWMQGYSNPKTTKAREISDDNKKIDKFNEDLKKKDLDAVRRKLSGGS